MNGSRHDRRRQRKLERTRECPCGSGKIFKKCCGAKTSNSTRDAPAPISLNTSNNRTIMGLSGEPGHLHVINQFKGDDPRNHAPLQGSPGQYTVTFVLNRPGYNLQAENQFSFATGLEGDSHLAVTKPAFVPPGNPEVLRSAIAHLLAFPGEAARLGANARDTVESKMSLDLWVSRIAQIIREVATRMA